jgi:hypothetical protein
MPARCPVLARASMRPWPTLSNVASAIEQTKEIRSDSATATRKSSMGAGNAAAVRLRS